MKRKRHTNLVSELLPVLLHLLLFGMDLISLVSVDSLQSHRLTAQRVHLETQMHTQIQFVCKEA